jgi:phospholipase C
MSPEEDIMSRNGEGNWAGSGVSRREFLGRVAGAGALAVGARGWLSRPAGAQVLLPPPAQSGIDHVVVVMMENRSFDHYLGWVPGADGRQAGLTYTDRNGVARSTFPLAPDYQGCGHPDPDHSAEGGRVEYNNGACDGWLRAGANDEYAIGYYTNADLSFFGRAAQDWTVCDRYFSSVMTETFPNRFHQHAAQTDRIANSFELSSLPTIWDRLAERGLTGRYYVSDSPFLAFWGLKYLPISRHVASFFADCQAGTLPQVSFVEPRFIEESTGLSNDDHPHADVRGGQAFLNRVYRAVTTSPAWSRIVLVINYDEWGGFFDHVPPPVAAVPSGDQAVGLDGLRGFRVPNLVVSPFARRGFVSHTVFDHASVLKLIEWRWDLPPLTVRDATAANLAEVLDFANASTAAPVYAVPEQDFPTLCIPASDKWTNVVALAASLGWPVQPATPTSPAMLRTFVQGRALSLFWDAIARAVTYRLEAGYARGFNNVQTIASTETTATAFYVPEVPPGRYFLRLIAKDQFGNVITTSDDVEVIVR